MSFDSYVSVYNEFDIQGHAERLTLAALASSLESALAESGSSPFAAAADFRFTNSADEVREWLGRCAAMLTDQYGAYKSLYSEINGFDINYDRWFASLMAAEEFIPADAEAEDWAEAEWILHYREDLTLTGSDEMQNAFRWRHSELRDQKLDAAAAREEALAQWLVWARWLDVLHQAWTVGPIPGVGVALTATAHGFETLIRLEPSSE